VSSWSIEDAEQKSSLNSRKTRFLLLCMERWNCFKRTEKGMRRFLVLKKCKVAADAARCLDSTMEQSQLPLAARDQERPAVIALKGQLGELANDRASQKAASSLSRRRSGEFSKDGLGRSTPSSLSRGSSGDLTKSDALRRAAVDSNRLKEAERCLNAYEQSQQYWVSPPRPTSFCPENFSISYCWL